MASRSSCCGTGPPLLPAGLAALGRLVVFDKRGISLSDPMTDWSRSAQNQWAEDLVAVVEAADLHHPVVVS